MYEHPDSAHEKQELHEQLAARDQRIKELEEALEWLRDRSKKFLRDEPVRDADKVFSRVESLLAGRD